VEGRKLACIINCSYSHWLVCPSSYYII